MPNSDNKIPIVTSPSYKVDPADQQSLQEFLSSVPIKVRPSSIVVVDPQIWSSVAKNMSLEPTGVAFTVGDRVYLNGAAFHPSAEQQRKFRNDLGEGGNLATFALAHELAHMQDTEHPRAWQEQHDAIYNQNGKKIYAGWEKAEQAQRNQNAQMEKTAHDTRMGILEKYFENPLAETQEAPIARNLNPTAQPDAENIERHDHPVIAAAGGMKGEPAPVLLQKLNGHIGNMGQDEIADTAAKFGITAADDIQTATAKLHQALSAPVAA
jgi:hypothetical protein